MPFVSSMSSTGGIGSAQSHAIAGIRSGTERMNHAAAQVAHIGAAANNASVLEISDEARAASGQALGAGLEGAMVDTRVAKYQVAANVRTLQTADEMSQELVNLVGR